VRCALYRLAVVAAALLIPFASGCGGRTEETEAGTHLVRVTERDFRISAPKRVPAGEVVFTVTNKGPDDHELLLIKESEGRGGSEEEEEEETPLRPDGLSVDEDALGSSLVDELEPEEPGVRKMRVRLRPGQYEFLCNMAGHYFGGMEAGFEVQ
jgi:uncharacterized cupredoxin-like copper-binding protein